MSAILYTYGGNLYINLTNRCPCACTFCIRSGHEGVGSANSLWLEADPTAEEVIAELKQLDLTPFGEVIFCGYGEPLCALDTLLEVCRYLRTSGVKIRINTNGLADLIHGKPVAPLLAGLVDIVSVSLNAPDAEKYNALCHPDFGLEAYGAMLRFAGDCKRYVPQVKMSVVDVIPPEDISDCESIAENMQIPLRVRHYG